MLFQNQFYFKYLKVSQVFLTGLFVLFLSVTSYSQEQNVVLFDFENGSIENAISEDYTLTKSNDLQVGANVAKGEFKTFSVKFNKPLDLTHYSKFIIKIKNLNPAFVLRMDVVDDKGVISNKTGVSKTIISGDFYLTYDFDLEGSFEQSVPEIDTVDRQKIVRIDFVVNPGGNAFKGNFNVKNILLDKSNKVYLINTLSDWTFADFRVDVSSGWNTSNYNVSNWLTDSALFGWGAIIETTLKYGPRTDRKRAYYFRKNINVDLSGGMTAATFSMRCDDGAVVYINGKEAYRFNMPEGLIKDTTFALRDLESAESNVYREFVVPASLFIDGENLIAVEIHNSAPDDKLLYFDLSLSPYFGEQKVLRGPYLNSGTPESMVVKWRTIIPSQSKIWFGTQPGVWTDSLVHSDIKVDHEFKIPGLSSYTKYYYSIGDPLKFKVVSDGMTFKTSPKENEENPYKFWVIGDQGTADGYQRLVRNSYYDYVGDDHTDGWLWLGDNAYTDGTDEEYQKAAFEDMYEKIMENTVIWPTPGNHDYDNGITFQATNEGPYYDIFTLPKNAEAGGVASGTESYYSYNYGNVHFISLDSEGDDDKVLDETGKMFDWLKADLEANTKTWLIAYWHHAPYTKGSHDSDNELRIVNDSTTENKYDQTLVQVREQILPILEKYGVDLVLCGHSHSYERSHLLRGHYEISDSIKPSHILDSTGGHESVRPYVKNPNDVVAPNWGAVYSVVGVSGKKTTTQPDWPHPAMYYSSVDHLGSMVLDIHGDTLRSKFLTSNGKIEDEFAIVKTDNYKLNPVEGNVIGEPLFKVYPNPVTNQTKVYFSVDFVQNVKIELISKSGLIIGVPFDQSAQVGYYEVDLTKYFSLIKEDVVVVRMITNNGVSNEKVLNIK